MNAVFKDKKLLLTYFLAMMFALTPFATLGVAGNAPKGFATTVGDLLNPDTWFKALKENITIPISKDQEVKVPTPEQALKEASPKLQEVNQGVKEQTGIDLAKFIGWFANVLKVFFQIIVDLLERVSEALRS